ncbi:MAG: alpha/beta hydrolase [archaeon]|nr:alpha/beta hydrolase [archaeon]
MENDANIKFSYETLWKAIIRPPRDIYTEEDLLDSVFIYNSKTYYRRDYDILNKYGFLLKCSFIEPAEENRPSHIMPVVIYLHGNSSSRLEGMKMAPHLLKININIFVFDFAGSGLSEGEYISLGHYEKEDVQTVVDFVQKLPGVGNIGLWGRSMGAATSLLYGYTDNRIKCMVVDSPFAEFRLLAKQLCKNYKSIPFWLVDFAFLFIKKSIMSRNGLDIDTLNPIEVAKYSTIPCFFLHAMSDELIPLEHSVQLYEQYGCPMKSLNVVEGGHNSKRKKHIMEKIGKFFTKFLCEDQNISNEELKSILEKKVESILTVADSGSNTHNDEGDEI